METLSDQQNCLISILTCLICQQKASHAHICPNCSKFYCYICITTWIESKINKCPYCTEQLNSNQLVNCQNLFIDLSNAMDSIKSIQNSRSSKIKSQKKCEQHDKIPNYYCQNCQIQLCSDCCVLSPKHQSHSIIKISQAKRHLQKQYVELKTKITNTIQKYEYMLQHYKQNPVNLQTKISQNNKKFKQYIKNLKQKTNKRFINQITNFQHTIKIQNNQVENSNQIYHKSLQFIKNCPKVQFVGSEAEIIQNKLKQHLHQIKIANKELSQKVNKHKINPLQSEIVPQYQSKTFSFINYGQLCYLNQMIYSDTLQKHGAQWRLKIYPAGNQNQQKPSKQASNINYQNNQDYSNNLIKISTIYQSYLSIFIQLKSCLRQSGKYHHKIILQHPKDKSKNIERQFESIFTKGQCWGYDKFIKIKSLYENGFVDKQNQQLKITLLICPANYYQAYQDLKLYINKRKLHLQQIQLQKADKVQTKSTINQNQYQPQNINQ